MNTDEITLAEVLKDAGYRPGLFGKWHLGAHIDHGPTQQGFDEFFGIRNGFIDNFNHNYLHREGFHDLYEGIQEVFHDGKYFPDLATDRALAFLDKNQSNPFFLYLGFNIPHYPEQADAKFDARYADLDEPRRSYAKIVSTTDDHIGRVLRKLEALGIRNKTVVVFVSDNGHSSEDYEITVDPHNSGLPKGHNYGANGGGGNTGKWRGAKGSFFEGGIRVPMIINFPAQLPKGVVRDQSVSIADFFPTLLELCAVPQPNVKLDGMSMLPVIRTPDAPTAHSIMHWQWQERWAVRQGEWKLIFNGTDTTDPWQGHPEPRRKIPKVFLGNLSDARPELTNHAQRQSELVAGLLKLHEEWSNDVFGPSTP